MSKYLANESGFGNLPPHIYASGDFDLLIFIVVQWNWSILCIFIYNFLANKAMQNLKLFKRQQHIVITGVSGSGKTENANHVINFLCHATESQNLTVLNPILEQFGNARTQRNTNSSRFCKNIEVHYLNWSNLRDFI